jgi:hypothetical protein
MRSNSLCSAGPSPPPAGRDAWAAEQPVTPAGCRRRRPPRASESDIGRLPGGGGFMGERRGEQVD